MCVPPGLLIPVWSLAAGSPAMVRAIVLPDLRTQLRYLVGTLHIFHIHLIAELMPSSEHETLVTGLQKQDPLAG